MGKSVRDQHGHAMGFFRSTCTLAFSTQRLLPPYHGLIALLLLCLVSMPVQAEQKSTGYFLTWPQKGELIKSGYINNNDIWYNIHLVPGYTPPWRYSTSHWRLAGSDLASYGSGGLYRDLYDTSRNVFRWGSKSSMMGYAINGSRDAWEQYLTSAQEQTQRRIFGWWLSYPWAGFKGTLNTGWRYVMGTTGMIGAYTTGALLVPSYYLIEPAVSATWHAGVTGVVLPVSAAAWNTVISPPLAMLGQRPAPERVDGFWVSITRSPYEVIEPVVPASARQLEEVIALSQLLARPALQQDSVADNAMSTLEQEIIALEHHLSALKTKHRELVTQQSDNRSARLKRAAAEWQSHQTDSFSNVDIQSWWWRHRAEVAAQLRKRFGKKADVQLRRLDATLGEAPPTTSSTGFEDSTDPLREALGEGEKVLNEGW